MWEIEGQRPVLVERFGLCFAGGGVSESDGGGAAGRFLKARVCVSVLLGEGDGQKSVREERCGKGRALSPPCCARRAAPLLGKWGRGFPARRGTGAGGVGNVRREEVWRRRDGGALASAEPLRAAPMGANSSLVCANDVTSALSLSHNKAKAGNEDRRLSWSFWGGMDWGC